MTFDQFGQIMRMFLFSLITMREKTVFVNVESVPGYKNKSKKEDRQQRIRGNKGKRKEMRRKRSERKTGHLYLSMRCEIQIFMDD